MRLFVDASAWVPWQVSRDQHAFRLRQLLRDLAREPFEIVTSNWTVYEALAVAKRWGHTHARRLYARIEASSTVLPVSEAIEVEALRRFISWADKSASVVDHANLLTAVASSCSGIISFDEDFSPLARQAGLQLYR